MNIFWIFSVFCVFFSNYAIFSNKYLLKFIKLRICKKKNTVKFRKCHWWVFDLKKKKWIVREILFFCDFIFTSFYKFYITFFLYFCIFPFFTLLLLCFSFYFWSRENNINPHHQKQTLSIFSKPLFWIKQK